MAKVTVTFKDCPDGTISIESDPPIENLMKMKNNGEYLSVAHNYAIFCMRVLYAKLKGKIYREKIVKN